MHVIRLRGPYEFQAKVPLQDVATRVDLPLPQISKQLLGGVLIRRFGKPTGLEPSDQVFVVVESFPVETKVLLNGEPLTAMDETPANVDGGNCLLRQEIGRQLLGRNELRLELPAVEVPAVPPNPDGWLQVRLEIVGRYEA